MNVNDIEYYLNMRPGYLKKGADALCDILETQGYKVNSQDCATALANMRKSQKQETEPVRAYTQDTGSPMLDLSGVKPVKVWGKEGNWNYSYDLNAEDPDKIKKFTDDVIDELKQHIDSRPVNKISKSKGKGSTMAVITDLHIGAQVGKLVNETQDYSINHVVDYLDDVAAEINKEQYERVHVSILGDLIESFTGMNHPTSWMELEESGYGANILIIAYEILTAFLSKINNLEGVYIIGGNHDRVTSSNKEDLEGGVAKTISYFINKSLNCTVTYDHMIRCVALDGIDYILTHGHLNLIKKSPEFLILNYGKNRDNFTMILSGHLHSRSKTEQMNVQSTLADCKTYRALVCPSIFTGNFYSESMGFSTSPGFLMFNSRDGKPRVTDITL